MWYKGKVTLGIQTTANRKFNFAIDLQTEINLQNSFLKYNLYSKLSSRLTNIGCQKQPLRDVLRICSKITGEHPCQSVISIKFFN